VVWDKNSRDGKNGGFEPSGDRSPGKTGADLGMAGLDTAGRAMQLGTEKEATH